MKPATILRNGMAGIGVLDLSHPDGWVTAADKLWDLYRLASQQAAHMERPPAEYIDPMEQALRMVRPRICHGGYP